MTFLKPSSTLFAYKGIIPSAVMNAINNDFPNALDKTGDTIPGEIVLTGTLDVDSTGIIDVESGGEIIVESGALIQINGQGTIATGGNLAVGTGGVIQFNNGSTLQLNNGSTIQFGATSSITGNMHFGSAVSAPIFNQADSTGGCQDLTIQAQNTSSGIQLGGNLILTSGSATSGAGNVSLQVGGTTEALITFNQTRLATGGSAFSYGLGVFNWSGTPNTQIMTHAIKNYVLSTAASGSNVEVGTGFTIPNSTGALIEVAWVRRSPTAGTSLFANKAALTTKCNGSGTVTASSLTAYVTPSGSFDDPGTLFNITFGANTIHITAVAQSAAFDWQVTLTIEAC